MTLSSYAIACRRADLHAACRTAKYLPREERRAMVYRAVTRYLAVK